MKHVKNEESLIQIIGQKNQRKRKEYFLNTKSNSRNKEIKLTINT
jgi:hypothetical protein